LPLCALIVLDSATGEALRDYRDLLPPQIGGIVLVGGAVETTLPRVVVTPEANGWRLTHGSTRIRVATARPDTRPAGLVRVEDASDEDTADR
jgi:hypothetical protein